MICLFTKCIVCSSLLLQKKLIKTTHYVKSVRIRSYSGPHFPAFGLNIQSECGKMRTRVTPNADTFHPVTVATVRS